MKFRLTQYVITNKEGDKYLSMLHRFISLKDIEEKEYAWEFRDIIRPTIESCKEGISWIKYYAEQDESISLGLDKLVKEGFIIKPITVTIKL